MRTLIAVVVVGVVAPLFEPAPAVAQRLQPAALIAAEAVFIGAGDGIEEKWLTHAESEFRRQERFDLVPLPADADLLAVFSSARRGRSLVGTRLKVSQLNVIDRRTGAGLWSEDREVQWAERGTVMDLVKSLHHELEGAFAIPVPERPCGGGTEVGVGPWDSALSSSASPARRCGSGRSPFSRSASKSRNGRSQPRSEPSFEERDWRHQQERARWREAREATLRELEEGERWEAAEPGLERTRREWQAWLEAEPTVTADDPLSQIALTTK